MASGIDTKPGWQTTEFWLALGVNLIAVAALFGAFDPADTEGIRTAYGGIVGGIVAVVTNIVYIWSRVRIKTQ